MPTDANNKKIIIKKKSGFFPTLSFLFDLFEIHIVIIGWWSPSMLLCFVEQVLEIKSRTVFSSGLFIVP